MRWIPVLFVALTLTSCFAPREVRRNARAERLVDRAVRLNPQLLDSITVTFHDTIPFIDTIPIPGADIDTLVPVVPGDSVVIIDTATRTKVVVRWRDVDTSGLYASIRLLVTPDTIVRYLEVPVEVEVPCPPSVQQTTFWRWIRSGWRLLMLACVLALIGGLIWFIFVFLPGIRDRKHI